MDSHVCVYSHGHASNEGGDRDGQIADLVASRVYEGLMPLRSSWSQPTRRGRNS